MITRKEFNVHRRARRRDDGDEDEAAGRAAAASVAVKVFVSWTRSGAAFLPPHDGVVKV